MFRKNAKVYSGNVSINDDHTSSGRGNENEGNLDSEKYGESQGNNSARETYSQSVRSVLSRTSSKLGKLRSNILNFKPSKVVEEELLPPVPHWGDYVDTKKLKIRNRISMKKCQDILDSALVNVDNAVKTTQSIVVVDNLETLLIANIIQKSIDKTGKSLEDIEKHNSNCRKDLRYLQNLKKSATDIMEINYSDILINQKDGEKGLTKIEYT